MNETTWKKTFVKENEDDNIDNPKNEPDSVYDDILKMQQKLQNINRRREAMRNGGYKENYKNIELFQSIYQKLYDDEDTNDSDTDSDIDNNEGFKGKKKKKKGSTPAPRPAPASSTLPSSSTVPPPPKPPKKKTKKIRNVNDLKEVILDGFTTVSEAISSVLFYIPKRIDNKLTEQTNQFSKIYSEKNASPSNVKKDANVIKQFIYQIVSFIIGIWVALNWFFLMIYKKPRVSGDASTDCDDDGSGFKYAANDKDRFKINFNGLGQLTSIFEKYLDFAIMPLWTFNEYVLGDKYGKKVFTYIPLKIISHFIILWGAFHFVYDFNFFTMIKNTIDGKMSFLNMFAMITIGCLWVGKVYKDSMAKVFEDEDLRNFNSQSVEKLKNAAAQMTSPMLWLFMKLMTYIFLLLIAAISVNVAVIQLVLFLWFMSLFAIPYYVGFGDTWTTILNMYEYISKDFDNNAKKIKDIGVINSILGMIATFLHKNTYYIGFIVLMLFNLLKMNIVMSSTQLKLIMSSIMVSIIGIIGSFVWKNANEPPVSNPIPDGGTTRSEEPISSNDIDVKIDDTGVENNNNGPASEYWQGH